MTVFYDRGYRIPVWVVLNLEGKKLETVVKSMTAEGAHYMVWPAHTFIDTIKDMGRKGWNHITGQPVPYRMDVNFLATAAMNHIRTFNPAAILSGSHDKPYQQTINRTVAADGDYARIFDEVLNAERDAGLSQIFGTGERKAGVYLSAGPVTDKVVTRLTDNLLTVGEEEGNVINTTGLKPAEIKEAIVAQINARLGLS